MSETVWNKNFTLITVGSIVSVIGSAMSGFALGLLVLDRTGSTFLYAMFMVLSSIPSLVVPVIAGPFIDRFSRCRIIYSLDFLSSVLYGAAAVVFYFIKFSYPVLIVFILLVSTISSIYYVAYESFYPMLVEKRFLEKAYSVDSALKTFSMIIMPVSVFVYKLSGIAPLLAVNALCFFISAVMETKIHAEETYTVQPVKFSLCEYRKTFTEGVQYLKGERGLLAITLYFTINAFACAADNVVSLPFFKKTYAENGEYMYMIVMLFYIIGRTAGGGIHYLKAVPKEKKYIVAFAVYIAVTIFGGSYLFVPVQLAAVFMFLNGALGITSYSIRLSGTQSYVPDEKKGRFNGVFQMFSSAGMLAGQFFAGVASRYMAEQYVLALFMTLNMAAVFAVVWREKRSISVVYNR